MTNFQNNLLIQNLCIDPTGKSTYFVLIFCELLSQSIDHSHLWEPPRRSILL